MEDVCKYIFKKELSVFKIFILPAWKITISACKVVPVIFCITNTALPLPWVTLLPSREYKFIPETKGTLNLISNTAVVFHSVGNRIKLEHNINETKS